MASGSGVVVVHPRGRPAYEAALAARDAGLLRRYVTTLYRGKRAWPLPRMFASRLDGELRRRWHPELAPELVATEPVAQVLYQVARRALPLPARVNAELELAAVRAFGRRAARRLTTGSGPGLVHAYEGAALEVMRSARRAGWVTVLDVQSLHEHYLRIEREEALRWDMPGSPCPFGISRRVASERAEADILLAPNDEVRVMLLDAGVPAERIVVLPFGADPHTFRRPAERPAGGFRVLYLGHLNLRKGIGYLLEAWSRMAPADAELLLVGNPDPAGRRLLARYRGCHRTLPNVPYGELPAILAGSDVLVCPSLSETGPLVVYEAMAAGLPVVTTEAARGAVRHGIDGLVVPPRDVDALAAAISFLHAHPEARRRMSREARRRIEEGFTWRHYRTRLATIYRHLLERRPEPLRATWGLL
jgi:glycosyltransferase involved in cell wall biosynthesis